MEKLTTEEKNYIIDKCEIDIRVDQYIIETMKEEKKKIKDLGYNTRIKAYINDYLKQIKIRRNIINKLRSE